MSPFASLSVALLLALLTDASPVEVRDSFVRLPIARKLNLTGHGGAHHILQHDLARGARLSESGSIPISNYYAASYAAEIYIGSPPTTSDLLVDTGSPNTWVGGSNTQYVQTKTSVNTGQPVLVYYGYSGFQGTEYIDTVSLGEGLTITQQSIGVADESPGFSGYDGILGIGPVDLTLGTLTNEPKTEIPTVTQNLYAQKVISENIVGISFEPSESVNVANGEVTFGGTDSTKYIGEIAYVPIISTYPASAYWSIDGSITYGTKNILSKTAGVVDTGTTLMFIATDAFDAYKSATGGTVGDATGLLRITNAQYAALENLNFGIGSETYALTPNGQIWPRSLNTYIGGTQDSIYLIVADLGTPSGQGLDFMNGYAFLQRFYSVYDSDHSRVGSAKTTYTDSTIN